MQQHDIVIASHAWVLAFVLATAGCESAPRKEQPAATAPEPTWISLFNGRDLDGWTVKIRGHELGHNHADTFQVQDGILRVRYDNYARFDGEFGHLFYATPFSEYRLRVEYRFVGEQCTGGPGWARRNSGVMLHSQSPLTMGIEQEFPVSIEAQMLGGNGTDPRTTGNLCTPGTHVVMDEELILRHCTNSSSETYHGEQWVTFEVEVRGNEVIRHWIDGKVVLEYQSPQLDPRNADAKRLLADGVPIPLSSGWIALQAESHPVDFRRVEILPLGK